MELSRKVASAITTYAKNNHVDVIVFEYLEMKGKAAGKKKQKLHLWRKRDIQKLCEHQAHRTGMRVSRVCAWNTSRLAYIGARYFIRERLKPLSATVRSSLEAKVPSVKRRTSCVYADLLLLSAELGSMQAA